MMAGIPLEAFSARYGVEILDFPSPTSLRFAFRDYVLAITLDGEEVVATISNDSVPAGKLPRPRRISIEGDVLSPVLVEPNGAQWTSGEAFGELIRWFAAVLPPSALRA
jgi:hypothetical protein